MEEARANFLKANPSFSYTEMEFRPYLMERNKAIVKASQETKYIRTVAQKFNMTVASINFILKRMRKLYPHLWPTQENKEVVK